MPVHLFAFLWNPHLLGTFTLIKGVHWQPSTLLMSEVDGKSIIA